MAPDADHPAPTLTLTRSRTLWGDLCLDAVACEGSRPIRGMLWMGGAYFKTRAPGCAPFARVLYVILMKRYVGDSPGCHQGRQDDVVHNHSARRYY